MRRLLTVSFALTIVTALVYYQVHGFDFINLDDDLYVTRNQMVQRGMTWANLLWAFTSFNNLAGFWHPVTWLSHMTDVSIYGMNAGGHHLTSLFIHIICSLLLLNLLFRTTGEFWRSAFVAAMFALHPLRVESVAWVAERKDVLSAFFWFTSLIFYSEYVSGGRKRSYAFALLAFALGLMSKPMTVTLPVAMLAMDYWPLNRYQNLTGSKEQWRTLGVLIKEKIPFFVLSAILGIITIYTQNMAEATKLTYNSSLFLRMENALTSYMGYILKTFWPYNLAIYYPYPLFIPLWKPLLYLAALAFCSYVFWRKRSNHPYLLMGWLWFLLTLVPVIGLIQAGNQAMADRFSYIPGTGLFIMVAWGIPAFAARMPKVAPLVPVIAGVALASATLLTYRQLGFWKDSITVLERATKVTDRNTIAYHNLGVAYATKGETDKAIGEYRKALSISPGYADAHYNLALALESKGRLADAADEYNRCLAINTRDTYARYRLALALQNMGEFNEALSEYHRVVALDDGNINAHYNLGTIYSQLGDIQKAIEEYRKTLSLNDDYIPAHNNLGVALAKTGQLDDAVREFQAVLAKDATNAEALRNLALAVSLKQKSK